MVSIQAEEQNIRATINLPTSKSESNRLLLIQAICSNEVKLSGLSEADDTLVLKRLLASNESKLDVGLAGSTFRFLTAYFAALEGKQVVLTGAANFKRRPVGILVEALRSLGAEISYQEQEGFPPLQITGKKLSGGSVEVAANVSSQYISALLLIAPLLKNALTIQLQGNMLSRSYIEMTLKLMQHFGVTSEWKDNQIKVNQQSYAGGEYQVEADWSAASYWFTVAAFSKEADVLLKGLKPESSQGDQVVMDIFFHFGVESTFEEEGLRLRKTQDAQTVHAFAYNFTNCPDLAQTVAVCCAGLNMEAELSGLDNLPIKETNRITALENELNRLGYSTKAHNNRLSIYKLAEPVVSETEPVATYNDHRMAMAFAPLALLRPSIQMEQAGVVNKSYPSFWEEMAKCFRVIRN